MSLNIVDVLLAVRARLVASGGSDISGVWVDRAPPNTAPVLNGKPYLIISATDEALDSFTHDGLTVTLFVTIVDHADNDLLGLHTAWDRVYGNGDPGTDTAPTYGLHRHRLNLTAQGSVNDIDVLVYQGSDPFIADDATGRGRVMRFTANLEGVAPEE